MRALTGYQPWFSAIALGHKRIENRPWVPPDWLIGMRIAIHAGKTWDADAVPFIRERVPAGVMDGPREAHVFGAVIAVATVGGCVDSEEGARSWSLGQARWFMGPYGWLLDDIVALPKPVPCFGNRKLWHLPTDVLRRVEEQVGVFDELAVVQRRLGAATAKQLGFEGIR